jgi:hypothetical protein
MELDFSGKQGGDMEPADHAEIIDKWPRGGNDSLNSMGGEVIMRGHSSDKGEGFAAGQG